MLSARYTVVLKDIMENESTKTKLNAALSTYPLYEKQSQEEFIPVYIPTRDELNNKILNYYKYREIGFETVGRFLDELETSMNEIMPYYNQLLFSADQDFNVIYNVDYERNTNTTRSGVNSSTVNTTSNSSTTGSGTDTSTIVNTMTTADKSVMSDTPQNQLSIAADDIDEVDYANNVTWNKSDSNSTGSNTGTTNTNTSTTSTDQNTLSGTNSGTDNTHESIKGNYGTVSAQDLVLKYRETIINIVQQIINDERISELFMRVY